MKKKLPLVLAAVSVALLGVLYGGGYIGQFISNYRHGVQTGVLPATARPPSSHPHPFQPASGLL